METIGSLSRHNTRAKALGVEPFPKLRTIKYSGNKVRLLKEIVWLVRQALRKGDTVLDLMAGTHCIGYALKPYYRILANDVQNYSFIIGKAFIENGGYAISKSLVEEELKRGINKNQKTKNFHLFQKTYANTYFTETQCMEIDNIRAALDSIPSPRRELYLVLLMAAMSYTSNTTGHFAEYLNTSPQNPKSVQEIFFRKCEGYSVYPNNFENRVFNLDYKNFLSGNSQELLEIVKSCDLIYLDPPYSTAQYSRFYHILETLVKYDYPKTKFKGRYREDRHFSDFCRKSKAFSELDFALRRCSELNRKFVLLSYVDSKSCIIPKGSIVELVHRHFNYSTKPMTYEISHSKLGNGSSEVTEYLILATNSMQGNRTVEKLNRHFHYKV